MNTQIVDFDCRIPPTWRAVTHVCGGGVSEAISSGKVFATRQWHSGDMLTAKEVAELLGVSTRTITRRRHANKILGLQIDDKAEYRYPRWQFDNRMTAGVMTVLLSLQNVKPWSTFYFFTAPEPLLKGKTPLAVIRRGGVSNVLHVAKILVDDELL